jgi:hypothetical protein
MEDNEKAVRKAVDGQEKGLRSVAEEICTGVKEGITLGIKDGLRRGVKEGLEECLSGGAASAERTDFATKCTQILQGELKEAVRKGTKPLFDKPAMIIEDEVCAELAKTLTHADNPVSLGGMDALSGRALELAKTKEKEVFSHTVAKVPKNPMFMPIVDGLDLAFRDSLDDSFRSFPDHLAAAVKARGKGEKNASR